MRTRNLFFFALLLFSSIPELVHLHGNSMFAFGDRREKAIHYKSFNQWSVGIYSNLHFRYCHRFIVAKQFAPRTHTMDHQVYQSSYILVRSRYRTRIVRRECVKANAIANIASRHPRIPFFDQSAGGNEYLERSGGLFNGTSQVTSRSPHTGENES